MQYIVEIKVKFILENINLLNILSTKIIFLMFTTSIMRSMYVDWQNTWLAACRRRIFSISWLGSLMTVVSCWLMLCTITTKAS